MNNPTPLNYKRFIWNFQFCNKFLFNVKNLPEDSKNNLKFEGRFFWPENTIITLPGLNDNFLDLKNYKIKYKTDLYYLLPQNFFNIKEREGELFYKPLISKQDGIEGYGKKINLSLLTPTTKLPEKADLTIANLLAELKLAQHILVQKEALSYKFNTQPQIKLELARLKIKDKFYFTASIEGRSFLLVSTLINYFFPGNVVIGYVDFLKSNSQL